ncbi:Haemolysin XhlA, partial [Dysosmobacter welbionis]
PVHPVHPASESGGGPGPAGVGWAGTRGGQPAARQPGSPEGHRHGPGPAPRNGGAALRSGGSHHRWGAGLVRHRRQRPDVSRHRHGLYAVGAVRCVRRRGAGRRRGGCPGLRLL